MAIPVVCVQVSVLTEQFQPPVESVSVIAVAVRAEGSVMAKVMGKSVLALSAVLPLAKPTVIESALSPSLKVVGLLPRVMVIEGTTTGVTALERSKSAYSSIFSCAT